ncbi:hypothetical protein [Paenibacillus alvei]|uniref:hypothetical protein n=1 Tax=Paenibacillus alvei TaxID=44250 RepID=UPI0018CCED67|nr:hypothetical protein [Paenibacillus alvei]MCY9577942.1 hypothetical protein [Paenibacillus alvei]MCY9587737.1 hypothetical protein [Paenibacillus alvei]
MKSPKMQVELIVGVLEYIKSVIIREGETEFSELKKRDRKSIVELVGNSLQMYWDGDSDGDDWLLDTERYDDVLGDLVLSFHYGRRDDEAPYDMFVGIGVGMMADIESIDDIIRTLRGLHTQEAVNIVNLTPHTINIMPDGTDGDVTSIPSSGEARATTTREHYGTINGIQVYRTKFGTVQGLPKPQKDTIFIVSSITAQAVPEREDVFIPDDIVRDEQGRVIGCRALGRI